MFTKFKKEQPQVCKFLEQNIIKNKLSHAYLFITNNYNKSLDLAIDFIKEIIIKQESNYKIILNQIDKNIYNDLVIIDVDDMWIKKETIIDLKREYSNKSISNSKRFYIINNAHKLNDYSANSLLKFLEEPEQNIMAILITNNASQMIETILSRCILVNFNNYMIENSKDFNNIETIFKLILDEPLKDHALLHDENKEELINFIIEFIKYYEMNNTATIAFTNKLWFKKIKTRNDHIVALDIMLLIYNEVLKTKINKEVIIFKKYIEEIKDIAQINTKSSLCNKINVIIKTKANIKYNLNTKLLIDKMIIELGRE